MKKIFLATVFAGLAVVAVALYFKTPSTPPTLSTDKKSIIENESVLLEIEHPTIVQFFRDPSTGMCDESNIGNTTTRRAFCSDIATYIQHTRFTDIVLSPDGRSVGFVVETDELSPDTAVGFFSKDTGVVSILTNYYLGNEFGDFSPNGEAFVYKERCFENVCGFTVVETESLTVLQTYANTETDPTHIFLRWVDNENIEYMIGGEKKVERI